MEIAKNILFVLMIPIIILTGTLFLLFEPWLKENKKKVPWWGYPLLPFLIPLAFIFNFIYEFWEDLVD